MTVQYSFSGLLLLYMLYKCIFSTTYTTQIVVKVLHRIPMHNFSNTEDPYLIAQYSFLQSVGIFTQLPKTSYTTTQKILAQLQI